MTRPCPPFRAFLPGASAILSPKGAGHIRTVIYLDVLLLVNFVTTALFLLAAGLLSGVTASGGRVTAGAARGAAASLILLAPTAPWPLGLAYQTATGAVIVLAAYGWPGARCFLRLAAWFMALHLALTGAVLLPGAHSNNFSVYLPLSPGLLLLCAGGVYLAVQGVLRLLGRRGGQTVPATLLVAGAALPLRAFCDTGFSVQEPLSGRAVFLGGLPLLTGGSLAVALCRVAVTAKQLLTLREVGFFRRMALSAVKQSVLADIVLHLRGGGCHVLQNIFDFTCHKLSPSIQV